MTGVVPAARYIHEQVRSGPLFECQVQVQIIVLSYLLNSEFILVGCVTFVKHRYAKKLWKCHEWCPATYGIAAALPGSVSWGTSH